MALASAAAGCGGSSGGSAGSDVTCSPRCPAGTRCTASGCEAVNVLDLATLGTTGDLGSSCPPCVGATPVCNPATSQCVACLTDASCPAGQVCKSAGNTFACVAGCTSDARCDGGKKCCAGSCADVTTDASNCGACGTACSASHATSTCAAGQCATGACNPGWGDCNKNPADGCETSLLVDTANCGACGTICKLPNARAGCAGSCYVVACNFGFDNCDSNDANGCETSVVTDPKNCGGCGMSCAAVPHAVNGCVNAACQLASCDVGFADCNGNPKDGCEVNIFIDAKNCGACGATCGNGLICKNGGCTCPQCNFPNASSKCVNNVCVLDKCVQGFADCNQDPKDGCEVAISKDPKNCGSCGFVCPMNTPACKDGACSVGFDFGPMHSFTGLTSTHYITQGGCSAFNGNLDKDAQYFCDHFYGTPMGLTCTAVNGYIAGRTPNCNDAKMHKNNGCTNRGNDIPNTKCDGGACKIGDWNECTSGITNLVCHCE